VSPDGPTRPAVRAARAEDADQIARLSGELGYPVSAAVMRTRLSSVLASASDMVRVCEDANGAVIGWLQAHAGDSLESGLRVEILGLVVAGVARRAGVGRALVEEAERWARGRSADTLVVRSNVRRAESHRFYPAVGFSLAKTQHVYSKPLVPEAGGEGPD
jgi:GNAT superfamily N-acetyltransferase